MPKFITLTDINGQPFLLNLDHLVYFVPATKQIRMTNAHEMYLDQESTDKLVEVLHG